MAARDTACLRSLYFYFTLRRFIVLANKPLFTVPLILNRTKVFLQIHFIGTNIFNKAQTKDDRVGSNHLEGEGKEEGYPSKEGADGIPLLLKAD